MIYHNHHIIPRHAGGTDAPSNIKRVSVLEHAEEHRKLFEKHGRWQDDLAHRFLLGIVSKEEAVHESLRMGGRMVGVRPKSTIHKQRIGQSKIGKSRQFTDEWKKNLSLSTKGRTKPKFLCSCGTVSDIANLKRWHSAHKVIDNV